MPRYDVDHIEKASNMRATYLVIAELIDWLSVEEFIVDDAVDKPEQRYFGKQEGANDEDKDFYVQLTIKMRNPEMYSVKDIREVDAMLSELLAEVVAEDEIDE